LIYKKLNKFELSIAISTSVFILLFYLLFNFNYLSNWVDERNDVLTYDHYVKLGLPEFLFNPHHIGFDWLGKVMYHFLKKNGYSGSSMAILQLRNLIVSSLGLALFFFLFYKISKKYLLSLLITASIAFTAAYWMYSQINDTPIIHSVLVFLLFFATLYFPQAKNKYLYSIFLGIFHSINIFFHQYDSLFIVVIFFILVFFDCFKIKTNNLDTNKFILTNATNFKFANIKIKYFLIYFSTFILIVCLAYYYVGVVKIGLTLDITKAKDFNKVEKASYFFNWLILYAKINYWGKGFTNKNLFSDVTTGISTYFYQPQSVNGVKVGFDFTNFFSATSILPNMIGILFIFLFISIIIFFVSLYKKYGFALISTILFLIIYTIFSCWWEPNYREFWVATMFSFWVLIFLVFNYFIDNFKKVKIINSFFIYIYLFLFSSLLFYFNFTGFIYPNAGKEFRKFDVMGTTQINPTVFKKTNF